MKTLASSIWICFLFVSDIFAQAGFFKNEFPNVWIRAKDYTLEVAQAMPQARYQFKPSQENLTFAEVMIHIVQNMDFISNQYLAGEKIEFGKLNAETSTKEEIIEEMEKGFDSIHKLIKQFPGAELEKKITFAGTEITKENAFYVIRNHLTHHRGQAVIYLTMNGIEAPNYRGW